MTLISPEYWWRTASLQPLMGGIYETTVVVHDDLPGPADWRRRAGGGLERTIRHATASECASAYKYYCPRRPLTACIRPAGSDADAGVADTWQEDRLTLIVAAALVLSARPCWEQMSPAQSSRVTDIAPQVDHRRMWSGVDAWLRAMSVGLSMRFMIS